MKLVTNSNACCTVHVHLNSKTSSLSSIESKVVTSAYIYIYAFEEKKRKKEMTGKLNT